MLFYLSICRSIYLICRCSIYLFVVLSIYMSFYLSIYMSFYLSIYVVLSIYMSLFYLSICRSINLYVVQSNCRSSIFYQSIYLYILLSIYISIYLSVCLSIYFAHAGDHKMVCGWTDLDKNFCGTSHDPRNGLWMFIELKKSVL